MKPQQPQAMLPGISSLISATNELIRVAASNDNPVFLTGEVGTEKAFAAKLIHQLSARAPFPLTKINVSWKLPPDLASYFQQTNGGTLLIHLQKEFPIDMQYTLVEMAGDGCFADPLSGDVVTSDVRIIIMTSLDLEALGGRTPLLPELHELLVSQHVEIPPLRDRTEDIPAVVRYAVNRARETGRAKAKTADPQVISLFRQYSWPGNAEDLLLVTAQAAISAKGELITLDDLPDNFIKQFTPDVIAKARAVGSAALGTTPTKSDVETQTINRAETQSLQRGSAAIAQMPQMYTLNQPPPPPSPPPAPKHLTREEQESLNVYEKTSPAAETQSLTPPPPGPRYAAENEETRQLPDLAGTAITPPLAASNPTPVPTGDVSPKSPVAGYSPKGPIADATMPRVLNLARRLNSQSKLLGKQISGPLAADAAARLVASGEITEDTSDEEALKSLEREIDRGLDLVLSLRRQMAVLNMRHQESAETIRDLVQRLSYSSDTETPIPSDTFDVSQDAKQLTENLQAIDDIIRRVSTEVPMLSEHIQSTVSGNPSRPGDDDTQQPIFRR